MPSKVRLGLISWFWGIFVNADVFARQLCVHLYIFLIMPVVTLLVGSRPKSRILAETHREHVQVNFFAFLLPSWFILFCSPFMNRFDKLVNTIKFKYHFYRSRACLHAKQEKITVVWHH